MSQKEEKEIVDKEETELRNFPKSMAVPDEEQFETYKNLRRNPKDVDIMQRVWKVFITRLFPVLSLCYIASVFGISLSNGTHFLFDETAHYMSLIIMIWVAIAPVTWLFMRATIGIFKDYARLWYTCIATMQAGCGLVFFFLFPENLGPWLWGLQSFFVSSIPMHIVIYFLFMQRMLPKVTFLPLSIIGLIFMALGFLIP